MIIFLKVHGNVNGELKDNGGRVALERQYR